MGTMCGHSELKELLKERDLPVVHTASHIVPVMVCDAVKCKQASDLLLQRHGVYVQPINSPTVPAGQERLRFTPSPVHTRRQLVELADAMDEVWRELGIPRASHMDLSEWNDMQRLDEVARLNAEAQMRDDPAVDATATAASPSVGACTTVPLSTLQAETPSVPVVTAV
ncbi:MAG: hypothetical protein MHM6MM_007991 [Cercozoa sp. M6MM]